MKRVLIFFLISTFTFACAPAPTPEIIVITVVVQPTLQQATNTSIPTLVTTQTATPNPCLLWNEVTAEMVGQTICVRGLIRRIDVSGKLVHWDFAENNTGFFAISNYLGWHPVTGKGMQVGDCVGITGIIQALSNGRPYIFWGENSIYKAAVKDANTTYYEHPDLQVIEDNPSFCQ